MKSFEHSDPNSKYRGAGPSTKANSEYNARGIGGSKHTPLNNNNFMMQTGGGVDSGPGGKGLGSNP